MRSVRRCCGAVLIAMSVVWFLIFVLAMLIYLLTWAGTAAEDHVERWHAERHEDQPPDGRRPPPDARPEEPRPTVTENPLAMAFVSLLFSVVSFILGGWLRYG